MQYKHDNSSYATSNFARVAGQCLGNAWRLERAHLLYEQSQETAPRGRGSQSPAFSAPIPSVTPPVISKFEGI